MIVLKPITPDRALVFKAVRLRALQDTPSAFGSTYSKESQLTDDEWIERSANWSSDRSTGYLAFDEEQSEEERADAYCGIAASYLNEQNPQKAHLISMWVAPDHRQSGVGKILIDAIERWATHRGAHTLLLTVTSSNHPAITFYTRLGFSMTGNTEPYPNDPALIEYEMSKPIP
jgi:ribosomal protein S18 acetylase RimI-like enzyme